MLKQIMFFVMSAVFSINLAYADLITVNNGVNIVNNSSAVVTFQTENIYGLFTIPPKTTKQLSISLLRGSCQGKNIGSCGVGINAIKNGFVDQLLQFNFVPSKNQVEGPVIQTANYRVLLDWPTVYVLDNKKS